MYFSDRKAGGERRGVEEKWLDDLPVTSRLP